MKKIFFAFAFFCLLANKLFAGAMDFGFNVGLATPNNKVNEVYNAPNIKYGEKLDSTANLLYNGLKSGYHVGIKLKMKLNDYFDFASNIGYNSFPESKIEVVDPSTGNKLVELSTATKIVPISAGLSFYPFRNVIAPYVTGELTYNYINTAVEVTYFGAQIPIPTTPTDSRFGFGIGAGVDLNVGLFDVNVEAKYNYLNLIGKEATENDKHFVSLVFGIIF